MKTLINTKLFLASLFFMILGILSLFMENIFYGYIDQNGVLQESFFLPMSSFSFSLGLVAMIFSIIRLYLKRFNKSRSEI